MNKNTFEVQKKSPAYLLIELKKNEQTRKTLKRAEITIDSATFFSC